MEGCVHRTLFPDEKDFCLQREPGAPLYIKPMLYPVLATRAPMDWELGGNILSQLMSTLTNHVHVLLVLQIRRGKRDNLGIIFYNTPLKLMF